MVRRILRPISRTKSWRVVVYSALQWRISRCRARQSICHSLYRRSSTTVIKYIAPAVFILCTLHTAQAQIPAGGTSLTPSDFLATARRPVSGSDARSRIVDVEHADFNRALRVEILHEAGDTWSVEIGNTTIAPVARGDVALIHFWARGTESSDETGEVFFFGVCTEGRTGLGQVAASRG